ncbi:MAG: LamG-like jellyroll fold domain-containing protein, partial [Verrucomicrobiales bacterium]
GYVDAVGGGGASQVAISGINAEFADGYDLYVYFGSDGNNRTGKIALVDGATYSYNTFSQQGGDFPAQYTRTTDEGDGNPQSNYALYEGLSGDAQTVDLIRGSNNSGFHGIQIVSKGSGDYDGDGLSDLAEYEGVTSPIIADGDDDGLLDGAEVAAGTNPNNSDTDGDGIADGAEGDAGTDPLDDDSDDDGYTDGAEIAKGSDPTDSNSIPGLPTPIAYYNFEGKSSTALDRSFNDNTATASGAVTLVDGGAPTGSSPGAAAQLDGGHFRVPGIDMNSQIRDAGDGSYTMTAWIKPSALDGERFLFGQTNQGIHHGIRNGGFLHSAHWGADWNGATNLNDYATIEAQDGWIHAAWVYDGGADLGKIYLDGVLDKEQGQRAPNGGGHLIFGGRNNGEAQYRGLVDDVAIWAEALADAEVAQLAAGGSPIASLTDADGDGFVDAWEQRYAGNLTDLGAGTYSQTFTAPDGTTDMEDGSVIFGAANSVKDNRLQLTIDGQGLGFSSFSVPGLAGSSEGFTATFDYELFDSPGANDPADGLSFNYGNAPLGDQGQAEEGMAGRPGVTENISFEVDTWRNGDAEQGVNISGVAGGADVGQLAFTNGVILEDDSRKTGSISISWSPETGASFATSGLTTNADFADVATGDFVASDDHTFNISARVGGANQDFFIDNLVIRAGEADFDEDGLSDLAEYNSGASNPTKADSDDDGLSDGDEIAAGTQPLVADTDGDGLLDGAEGTAGTDPLDSDSDDDGYADGVEVRVGSDPTNGNSTPPSLVAYFDFESDAGPDTIVYDIEAGTTGNQDFGGALGMDFDTNAELTVTALGAFDEDSDGLNRDINVQLWSRDGAAGVEVLAELNFTGDDPGTLEGGQRFKALADRCHIASRKLHNRCDWLRRRRIQY